MGQIISGVIIAIVAVAVGFTTYNALYNASTWTTMASTFLQLAIGLIGVVLIIWLFTVVTRQKRQRDEEDQF